MKKNTHTFTLRTTRRGKTNTVFKLEVCSIEVRFGFKNEFAERESEPNRNKCEKNARFWFKRGRCACFRLPDRYRTVLLEQLELIE